MTTIIAAYRQATTGTADPLAGIRNEKQPDKMKMNTVEILLQNLNGWLRKETHEAIYVGGRNHINKMSMRY